MSGPARLALVDGAGSSGLRLALDAALATLPPPPAVDEPPELAALRRRAGGRAPAEALARALREPAPEDRAGLAGGAALGLGPADQLLRQLLWSVEIDPALGPLLARLQAPVGGARPTLGLCLALARTIEPAAHLAGLLAGPLFAAEIAAVERGEAPLAARAARLSPAMLALLGGPLARIDPAPAPPPPSLQAAAEAWARRLGEGRRLLVLRRGDPADARALTAEVATLLGRTAVDAKDLGAGAGAAAVFGRWLPVEAPETEAGRRARLDVLTGYAGPRVAICGADGGVSAPGWETVEATPPTPSPSERRALWRLALDGGEGPEAQRLGPARIAAIAARARAGAPGLRAAAGAELRPDLEPHAQLVARDVGDDALVTTPAMRADLDLLLARCRARGRPDLPAGPALADGRDGVRALLHGPSGGGKTLACSWLATRLGAPLFRVDLATVVSKYIGETEKNLSAVLDAAEAADVILLFDEADSLFGGRTEVKDSSDRFANNQTNFLLTRIEAYSGVVLLTTNSRQRLDAAFARRLDQIIEIPLPGPRERRDIWRAHLGEDHALAPAELNRLAAAADVSGGHIRGAVLTAVILAAEAGRRVGYADCVRGLALEYAKLAKSPPDELSRR